MMWSGAHRLLRFVVLALVLCASPRFAAGFEIIFDFKYDTQGFFDAARKETLRQAAAEFSILVNNLPTMDPSEKEGHWQSLFPNPSARA